MAAGSAQALVVGRDDRIALPQPGIQIVRIARPTLHPRGCAHIGGARRTVRPRDNRPAADGWRPLGKVDRAGDGDRALAIDPVRGRVKDAKPLGRVRQHQLIGKRLLAQQRARHARDLLLPRIEVGDTPVAVRRASACPWGRLRADRDDGAREHGRAQREDRQGPSSIHRVRSCAAGRL